MHGAVDVALEPVEELTLVARDLRANDAGLASMTWRSTPSTYLEVEELAVRLEIGEGPRRDASRETRPELLLLKPLLLLPFRLPSRYGLLNVLDVNGGDARRGIRERERNRARGNDAII